jgi:hypothetical protein
MPDSESDSDAGSVSRRHALHTAGVIVAGSPAIRANNYPGTIGDSVNANSANGTGIYAYGGIAGGHFQGKWGG